MGGFGSGRKWGKTCTDDMTALDVRRLHRAGRLEPGSSCRWQWSRRGEVVASIIVSAETGRVWLDYRQRDQGGEWKDVRHPVYLDRTPCTFGGERELAALLSELTGHEVKRRVRNLAGEDDLAGLPGWSIECKRYRQITPALLAGWWAQAVEQAARINCKPLLVYRPDRGQWRCRWPAALHAGAGHRLTDGDTLDADPAVWWALVTTTNEETPCTTCN